MKLLPVTLGTAKAASATSRHLAVLVTILLSVLLVGCGGLKDTVKAIESQAYDVVAESASRYCGTTVKAGEMSELAQTVVREERRQLANEIRQRGSNGPVGVDGNLGPLVKVYCQGEEYPEGLLEDITTKPELTGAASVLTGQYRGNVEDLDPGLILELKELGYDLKGSLAE